MQSFLPYPNFVASARVLDRARLGKQRVEGRQMQTAIQEGSGWSNHPCTKMWSQHVTALMMYTDCCIKEWMRRGYENNMPLMFDHTKPYFLDIEMPPWLGDERLHSSHRAALLHKDHEWYSQFGWTDEPKLEYFWPTVEETT